MTLVNYDRNTGLAVLPHARRPHPAHRRPAGPAHLRPEPGPGARVLVTMTEARRGDDHRAAARLTPHAPRSRAATGASSACRQDHQHPGRVEPDPHRPAERHVRGADAPLRARTRARSTGQRSPSEPAPRTGPIGNSETRVPAARSSSNAGGAEEAEVLAPERAPPALPGDAPARSSPRDGGRCARRGSRARETAAPPPSRGTSRGRWSPARRPGAARTPARAQRAPGRASESMSPITARNRSPPGSATSPPPSAATASGASAQRRGELPRLHRPRRRPASPARRRGRASRHCQSRITTADTLFFGEPSISLSE